MLADHARAQTQTHTRGKPPVMAPLIPKNADMYSIEWKLFLIKSICVFLRSLFVFVPGLKMDMVMLKASAQCELAHMASLVAKAH